MKKIASVLDKIFNYFIDYLFYIACVLVIAMMLVVVADALLKFSVKGTITWAFEATEYSLVYLAFLATAWLLRSGGHVKMDILFNSLQPRPQAYLEFIASILLVITCIMLFWYGTTSTVDNIQRNVMSVRYYSIPKFIILIVVPVGSFFLVIQALKQTYYSFRSLRQK